MCIFSGEAQVADTRIFAAHNPEGQGLVYEMSVELQREAAMVLALPVVPGTPSLEFIDLSHYPQFFAELERLFPLPRAGGLGPRSGGPHRLPVQRVGNFEASFVPTEADWGALDPRFQLDEGLRRSLSRKLPDYGYAVFKLRAGAQRVHPMALRFPSRDTTHLFFPTIHIHDGRLPIMAEFDHELYFQGIPRHRNDLRQGKFSRLSRLARERSEGKDSSCGLIDSTRPVEQLRLRGQKLNRDTWVALQATPHPAR